MRIVGSGASLNDLKNQTETRNFPVAFSGRIPHKDVREHYEWADTSLVHLKDWKPLQYTVPSKLYESLSAGRHITVAANGESARIVTETGVGLAVPAMNPTALANAWLHLAKHREELEIGDRGRLWLEEREYHRENADKFVDFVERCARGVG